MSEARHLGFRSAGVLTIVAALSCMLPVLATALSPASATPEGSRSASGYRIVASDGGVFAYGDADFYGSTGGMTLNKPIVGMASTPDGQGYWLVASDGGIFAVGDADFYGSTGGMTLNKPIVGMATTPDGQGYWLVASDGGIFAVGDADFYGSTGGMAPNKPIVGMATTPDGQGYWLVTSDGGILTYGDAVFFGTTGTPAPAEPIVGMASTPDGQGYWLVASDGGVSAYGDAASSSPTGGPAPGKPIVGITAASTLTAGASTATTTTATTTTGAPTTTTTATTTTTQPPDDPSGKSMPTTPPAGYLAFFADDFTSSTLGSNWHEYSGDDFGVYDGQAGTTWDPSHVTVGNGLLTLRTYQDPARAGPNSPWVEGGVALWPNSSLTYGEYLVRSRVTSATGVTQVMTLWTDTTWPPEIDFNESNGTNSSGATEWYNGANGATQLQPGVPSGVDLTQWHTWGVITTPSTITYTVDGKTWATMPNYVATPTHLTLQQMVWPCADPYETCPNSSTPPEVDMQIDWVAVYSLIS
jgi:hypothetical protein